MDTTANQDGLTIERGPDCLIVKIRDTQGDHLSTIQLAQTLLDALESHSLSSVVVDTENCSETPISELEEVQQHIYDRGGSLKVVDPRPEPVQVASASESKNRLPVYPSVETAFFADRKALR